MPAYTRRTSRLTIKAVSEAGISEAEVRLRYKVMTKILSAKGSRKLPSLDAWPGTVLAIHPSSYNGRKLKTSRFPIHRLMVCFIWCGGSICDCRSMISSFVFKLCFQICIQSYNIHYNWVAFPSGSPSYLGQIVWVIFVLYVCFKCDIMCLLNGSHLHNVMLRCENYKAHGCAIRKTPPRLWLTKSLTPAKQKIPRDCTNSPLTIEYAK